jgi:hypothetical protein
MTRASARWRIGAAAQLFAIMVGCRSAGSGSTGQLRVRVTELDTASEDLRRQVPFDCTLIRELHGPDRGQYILFSLDKPLVWKGRKATLRDRCRGRGTQHELGSLNAGV